MPKQALERRDPFVGDAAGDDEAEAGKIRVHVEREAVARDPAGDPDADGGELGFASVDTDPDAGEPGDAPRLDAEPGHRPDQHFLEVAHVAVHVAAFGLEVEDRIADELTRAVIRHVAAAAGLEQADALRGERLGRLEHVRQIVARLDAERDDVGVLEEQQRVGDLSALALLDERLLQREAVLVADQAETLYIQLSSKFSNRSLRYVRKRPASAPSIRRWS